MAYMQESDFHPKNPSSKLKRHRVTAPQLGIVNIEGLRDDYPRLSLEKTPPAWWNPKLENTYRCQMAGYRDEKAYLTKRKVKTVEKWPESGLIKKLVRWDGLYYYFSKYKECPALKTEEIKKAFLRETIIFENTAYTDKNLKWAPIITEQAQRFNAAYDEFMRNMRKPKKSKKSKSEAGPSHANRDEKSHGHRTKDKHLSPEEGVLSEKKKNKEKVLNKIKKAKENRNKPKKNNILSGKDAVTDIIFPKKKSSHSGKENVTQNVQILMAHGSTLAKRDAFSPSLPVIKESHARLKNLDKLISPSKASRSESQLMKEYKVFPRKKKKKKSSTSSSAQPSTSCVLKPRKDLSSPIPVSARVAALKTPRKAASQIAVKRTKSKRSSPKALFRVASTD